MWQRKLYVVFFRKNSARIYFLRKDYFIILSALPEQNVSFVRDHYSDSLLINSHLFGDVDYHKMPIFFLFSVLTLFVFGIIILVDESSNKKIRSVKL